MINIKSRIFRIVLTAGAYLRIRHFRGRGIHSPFVYYLVRKSLMKWRVTGGNTELYKKLTELHLHRRMAMQLQNVHEYCHLSEFEIITEYREGIMYDPHKFYLTHPKLNIDELCLAVKEIEDVKGSVAVLYPRYNKARFIYCKRMFKRGEFLSIDNKRYILFFFNGRVPKQHYRL